MMNFIYNLKKSLCFNISIFLYKNLSNGFRINMIRKFGGQVGERCRIHCLFLSDETYLVEIGDDVIIAEGTHLITHEGSITIFHNENPKLDLFGPIKIGNNCFIGTNCIILPNTTIGNNCVIGAGSVVRRNIPDNSVVTGNPGRVIMTTQDYKRVVYSNPFLYGYVGLSPKEKKRILLERLAELKKTSKSQQQILIS
jgi:acetyltransferase-like isoleucine patch superfamily enzyme